MTACSSRMCLPRRVGIHADIHKLQTAGFGRLHEETKNLLESSIELDELWR